MGDDPDMMTLQRLGRDQSTRVRRMVASNTHPESLVYLSGDIFEQFYEAGFRLKR